MPRFPAPEPPDWRPGPAKKWPPRSWPSFAAVAVLVCGGLLAWFGWLGWRRRGSSTTNATYEGWQILGCVATLVVAAVAGGILWIRWASALLVTGTFMIPLSLVSIGSGTDGTAFFGLLLVATGVMILTFVAALIGGRIHTKTL